MCSEGILSSVMFPPTASHDGDGYSWSLGIVFRLMFSATGLIFACWGGSYLLGAGTLPPSPHGARWLGGFVAGALIVGGIVLPGVAIRRIRIVLDDKTVTIVGLFRTTHIPLSAIDNVEIGDWGLLISYREKDLLSVKIGSAIQKPPVANWLKLSTRADDVLNTIATAARNRGGGAHTYRGGRHAQP